jgi:hypothetical protein
MKKIFIVAQAGAVSGGPEVLHQLGDCLNRHDRRAWMLYRPFGKAHEIPAEYSRYNVKPARLHDVEPGDVVILPEVCASLVDRFPMAQIYMWWLSVDFFFDEAAHTPPLGILGARALVKSQLTTMRERVACHLYQSEYARQFLESASLGPAVRLADYLADEYVAAASKSRQKPREDLVVFNPAKGRKRTKAILRALDRSGGRKPQIVPIKGMTRDEVCDLLGRAKLYLDFGGHPGKDRIPREAAALGACVLVNRRGSAANPVDVPISPNFKVDDREPGFEKLAVDRIHMLIEDYEHQASRFDDYRHSIALEPATFLDDVRSVFPDDL